MNTLNLLVRWNDGAEEELEFELYEEKNGYTYLVCPLCDNLIFGEGCAFGHSAYAIVDEDVDEKIVEAMRGGA